MATDTRLLMQTIIAPSTMTAQKTVVPVTRSPSNRADQNSARSGWTRFNWPTRDPASGEAAIPEHRAKKHADDTGVPEANPGSRPDRLCPVQQGQFANEGNRGEWSKRDHCPAEGNGASKRTRHAGTFDIGQSDAGDSCDEPRIGKGDAAALVQGKEQHGADTRSRRQPKDRSGAFP